MYEKTANQASRAPKVFISYAREDSSTAWRVYSSLKEAGAEPWLDTEHLLPGQRWKTRISSAIREADFFLALLSSKSVGKRGYVQKEIREALDVLDTIPEESIFIIPARLEPCEPAHPRFADLNWVDLFPLYEQGLRKILLAVQPPKTVALGTLKSAPLPDPDQLDQAGWGVIFPSGESSPAREALLPLLELRKQQAGTRTPHFYREFLGPAGYETGDDIYSFLGKHGMGPGPADPHRVPYYLLLVGSPDEIPFEFQYDLSIQYRVGRIHFDSYQEYENYARSVGEAEKTELSRASVFFGPQHDPGTNLLVTRLLHPLCTSARLERPDWSVTALLAENATKSNLLSILSSGNPPALLFVASHGLLYGYDHPRQKTHQGAIVCNEWPGPGYGAPDTDQILAAEDVPDADLRGMIVIYYGAFSAGTPSVDDFALDVEAQAPKPFVSALAKQLLGKRNGALGFIGHVDRTWRSSIEWRSAGPQLQTFESATRAIMSGRRVGDALRHFSERYAELAATLGSSLVKLQGSGSAHEKHMEYYIALFDARNYILIGDPACRAGIAK